MEILEKYIQKALTKNELYELEVRLGKVRKNSTGKKRFDTLIKKESYLQLLDRYRSERDYLDFGDVVFYESNRRKIRSRYDRNGKLLESIKKTRSSNQIIENQFENFDIRFSISKETPIENHSQFSKRKSIRKRRTSFYYPYTVVDFTISYRGSKPEYRVEIELNNIEFKKEEIKYVFKEILMHLNRMDM